MSRIGTIQILRALAAVMVVFSHAQSDAMRQALNMGAAFTRNNSLPWVSGVDLFFVTSGFIMVHASQSLFGTAAGAGQFLRRRLIRIVPLYWIITAISLVALFHEASAGKKIWPDITEIAGSFGFVPYARLSDGQMRPLAGQGWTLNYEMFFYLVFACFIRFRAKAAVAGVASVLMLIVGIGVVYPPANAALAFWSDPIILEFAAGMGLALLWEQGFRLSRDLSLGLALAALGLLSFDLANFALVPLDMSEPNGFGRLAGCGLPMALLFAAAVLTKSEVPAGHPAFAFLSRLGDSSYALYLFHPLVIVAMRKLYLGTHVDSRAGYWPLVMLDLTAAVAFSLVVHMWLERPVTAFLQRQFRTRREASPLHGAASPIS